MRGKRGQAGIEYVILVGFLLVFFIPIIHYALQETTENVKLSQLESFIGRVSKAVNSVHSIGPGTVDVVTVTLPNGVTEHIFYNEAGSHEIILRVSHKGGISDIHASVKPYVGGELPEDAGTYFLRIKCINESYVEISKN